MKRCPQCEFLYEDDQSLCDMDGVLLVFDSRTLPNLHALATVPPVATSESARRNRAVPAFATLILALVLGLVYYVSTRPNTTYTPAVVNSVTEPAPVIAAPTPVAIPEEATQPQPPPLKKEEAKPEATTKTPVKRTTTKATSNTQTRTAEPKKDSKVNSILKKTGRILKKPFKF